MQTSDMTLFGDLRDKYVTTKPNTIFFVNNVYLKKKKFSFILIDKPKIWSPVWLGENLCYFQPFSLTTAAFKPMR